MTPKIVDFETLSSAELYNCLQLRFEVFVLEQECLYPEFDEIDQVAKHFLLYENNLLAGYSRIYTDAEGYIKIGRIVTPSSHRKKGVGRKIINESLHFIKNNYPSKKVKINAQQHLKNFYSSFGFEQISEPYLDFGIIHIDMLLVL